MSTTLHNDWVTSIDRLDASKERRDYEVGLAVKRLRVEHQREAARDRRTGKRLGLAFAAAFSPLRSLNFSKLASAATLITRGHLHPVHDAGAMTVLPSTADAYGYKSTVPVRSSAAAAAPELPAETPSNGARKGGVGR